MNVLAEIIGPDLLILLLWVVPSLCFGWVTGSLARRRGHPYGTFFVIGMLFWVVGVVVAASLSRPDTKRA